MALDINIKNNLFRKVGAVGANVLSGKVIEKAKEELFNKLGENNIISARGFLGSHTARLIRELLFTKMGLRGQFDPVWKLSTYSPDTPQMGVLDRSDMDKTVTDDFAGADHPKYKFMYTVSFVYREDMKSKLTEMTTDEHIRAIHGSHHLKEMAFGLKTASRPNPTVVYQDVNFYNYRTKIATKVDYGTLTLTFYDDVNNRAHDIVGSYLQAISPISRIDNPGFGKSFISTANGALEDALFDPSSIGALSENSVDGPIEYIVISHHLPLQYSKTAGGTDSTVNKSRIHPTIEYYFVNPKITNINLDDLDMTQNDVSTVSMTLVYDTVIMRKQIINADFSEDEVEVAGSTDTALDKFLRGIDNKINPILNTVQDKIDQLNDSTLLTNVKDFIP